MRRFFLSTWQSYAVALAALAITGWGQEADRRRAIDAGFDYHLTKPVDPGALNELLVEAGSA